MPVKINEVIIRAVVSPDESARAQPSHIDGDGEKSAMSPKEKMELVQASVNEVLRILDQKRRP